MRNIWVIARKEYKRFFISPMAYAVAFTFLLILGIIFYANLGAALVQQFPLTAQVVVAPMVTMFLFSIPAVTMRTLAEEQRAGTMELLLTAPVRDFELVGGKWLGAFLFLLTLIVITLIYPLILNQLVKPGIDWGMVASAYAGLVLLAATTTAVGVAVSSLFSNQITAFFATLVVFLLLWMISFPVQDSTGLAADVLKYLSISDHFYNNFYTGVVDLKDVLYYLSMMALSLLLGTVSIETRRWNE